MYDKCLLMSQSDLYWLEDDEELQDKDEFILSIEVTSANEQEVLNTVLDYTGFENYEVLLEPIENINNKVYRIYR